MPDRTRLLRSVREIGPSVAWSAPALLASVVTGYLAWGAWVSAHDPAWLYQDGAWWRALLRPGQDLLPLLFAGLWLLSAWVFWWPRRRQQKQGAGLVVVAGTVVIGAVLGTASLAPCRGGQSPSAVFAWVLSLYVGALEPRYGTPSCPGQLPLALQVARTVCLAATFTGALAAAAVLWRQPVARLRARLVRDATILTGLDAMTIPLLDKLTGGGPPSHVVVIEPDRNNPLLDQARSTGAQIVVADPSSPQVLRPLLLGLRGPQLRYLFALRPKAADNEAVMAAARLVLSQSRSDPDWPPHLIARLDDPRHADVWRGERIGQSDLFFEDALSPQESTAHTLVEEILRAEPRQVLVCGDSTLALAVLLELSRHAWERKELAAAAAEGGTTYLLAPPSGRADGADRVGHLTERVVIVDPRAEDLRREFLATSPPAIALALPEVEATQKIWHEHLLPMLDAMTPEHMANTVILITDGPSEVGLHEAGRIARLHPETQVYVLVSDGAGVADAVFDRLHPFERTLLIDGALPDDSWTRIARHWHDVHRLAHPADSPGREVTRRPWGELDSFIRQDNILQLRSVMSAIVRLGRRWVPGRSVRPGSFVELTAADLRQVARDEHTRWYERRQRTGWSVPGANKDCGAGRADATLRPWTELADQLRDRACQQVSSQVAQLEAVGFMPVLPSSGPARAARFSRIGEVRAKRLTAENMWRNFAGEEFRGAPGDWLVVDDAGQERTVRDGEFRASHVLVAGDRWRRTGSVLAWQVAEPTSVRTLEGRATAQTRDWIVQGPGGERWPVRDAYFAQGYLPEGPPGRLSTGDVTAASSVTP